MTMSSTDFGSSIVGPSGVSRQKKSPSARALLAKYKTGGKSGKPLVRNRKQSIASALSQQRKGYAGGGGVSWWDQLQQAIQDFGPQSPLQRNTQRPNGTQSSTDKWQP